MAGVVRTNVFLQARYLLKLPESRLYSVVVVVVVFLVLL
jgi:hypothetical protein